MSETIPKIVVITPVKNEEWILDRFLSVTSQFADLIIVADQLSNDSSVEICHKYPKVHLIQNSSDEYDEAKRQYLLIDAAREKVPGHKIILALDADEVMAANAIESEGWKAMLQAEPGTVLCFEKPDLFLSPYKAIRYTTPWPVGYVDDGVEHIPNLIHSIRVPVPSYASILHVHDVKILHYGLTRKSAQESKMRFYSSIENIKNTRSLPNRWAFYSSSKDYTKAGKLSDSEPYWYSGWQDLGINMTTIRLNNYYWYDYEVLKFFCHYGYKKFWFDDIWDFDWERCRLYAIDIGLKNIPDYKVVPPPFYIKIFSNLFANFYHLLSTAKTILGR
ncbi:MAG: glycosyltransferase family 2 protein [Thermosynechococcaceae cyanobacterium MS004]|nr:glycosyltransferase family 2 protein [Thermosynechococcaceae cyanobacterium MS004]